jgi:hypothetical protein
MARKVNLIASPNLTRGYGVLDDAVARTVAGMAHFVDPNGNNACGTCGHWLKARSRRDGRCGLYPRLRREKQGVLLRTTQPACKFWWDGKTESPPNPLSYQSPRPSNGLNADL